MIPTAKGVSIGDKFMSHGKHPRECTVVDIYTTTNTAGEVVKVQFKAVHQFMGQELSELVVAPTVLLRKVEKK